MATYAVGTPAWAPPSAPLASALSPSPSPSPFVEHAIPTPERAIQTHREAASDAAGGETSGSDDVFLRVAPYQVAGHSSKGVGLPSLVDGRGHFLKPCAVGDRKGDAELAFYRAVHRASSSSSSSSREAAEDGVDAHGDPSSSSSSFLLSSPSRALAGFAPYVPAYAGTRVVAAAGIVEVRDCFFLLLSGPSVPHLESESG